MFSKSFTVRSWGHALTWPFFIFTQLPIQNGGAVHLVKTAVSKTEAINVACGFKSHPHRFLYGSTARHTLDSAKQLRITAQSIDVRFVCKGYRPCLPSLSLVVLTPPCRLLIESIGGKAACFVHTLVAICGKLIAQFPLPLIQQMIWCERGPQIHSYPVFLGESYSNGRLGVELI